MTHDSALLLLNDAVHRDQVLSIIADGAAARRLSPDGMAVQRFVVADDHRAFPGDPSGRRRHGPTLGRKRH